MSITHAKVSTIPDGANTDLVLPSDWNDEHVVDLGASDISVLDTAGNFTATDVEGALAEIGAPGVNLWIGPNDPTRMTGSIGHYAGATRLQAFQVQRAVTVTQVHYVIGSNDGNYDFGIYDAAGTRLASTGSTAMAGSANAWRTLALSGSVALVPGRKYFAGYAHDTAGGSLLGFSAFSVTAVILGPLGLSLAVASTYPLPATIVPGSTGAADTLYGIWFS